VSESLFAPNGAFTFTPDAGDVAELERLIEAYPELTAEILARRQSP
jgi:hypothetical protein